jgi:mono/diheme cytochrome c family protein
VKISVLIISSLACLAGPLQKAPPAAAARQNPFDRQERATAAGAKLYKQECAACHGSKAEGRDKTPPLLRADVQGAPAGAIFWVLRNGSLWRGMPSFAHLPDQQRWQIVAYIKSLNQ